jgi:cobalt-precorrin 5A hydrolase
MKTLSVGMGCRLHSSAEHIEAAVRVALGPHAFDQISVIASIDTKASEAGLLEFCARHALPLKLFSRAQIAAMPVTSPSAAVREHLSLDGVCEPCALLAAAAEMADAAATPAGSAALAAFITPVAFAALAAPIASAATTAPAAPATSAAPAALAAPPASVAPDALPAPATPTAPATPIACAASSQSQARLIVRKTTHAGVAVAIASIFADALPGPQPATTDIHEHEQDLS